MPKRKTRQSGGRAKLRLCLAVCELEFGVEALHHSDARSPLKDFARQVAMRLAHTAFGLNHTEIGEHLGRDRSTVAHACTVVEDACEDPVFAARIDALELRVRGAVLPAAGART